jgi:hypothetical protein
VLYFAFCVIDSLPLPAVSTITASKSSLKSKSKSADKKDSSGRKARRGGAGGDAARDDSTAAAFSLSPDASPLSTDSSDDHSNLLIPIWNAMRELDSDNIYRLVLKGPPPPAGG